MVGCEVSGMSTLIGRTSVRPSTAGGDLCGVAVYHPAYGDHERAVLQVTRSGQRSILLQRGPDRTARHEREERRQEDQANHSQARTLWSRLRH